MNGVLVLRPLPPALTTDPRFDRLTEGPGKPYLAGSLAFDPAPRAVDHNHPVMLSAGVTGKSAPRPFKHWPSRSLGPRAGGASRGVPNGRQHAHPPRRV